MRKRGRATANSCRNRGTACKCLIPVRACQCCKTPTEPSLFIYFVFTGKTRQIQRQTRQKWPTWSKHILESNEPTEWSTGILHWVGPMDLGLLDHTGAGLSSKTAAAAAAVPRLKKKTTLQRNTYPAWYSLFSGFVQSDLWSLTFCITYYFWVLCTNFFLKVSQNCTELWNVIRACFITTFTFGATCWSWKVSMLVCNTMNIKDRETLDTTGLLWDVGSLQFEHVFETLQLVLVVYIKPVNEFVSAGFHLTSITLS